MAYSWSLFENLKIVEGDSCVTTNAAVTGDYVSLKNAHKAWVVFHFTQAATHATICSILEATAVVGTSATAITTVMPNRYNQDTSTTDALTKGTAAATVTLLAGTTNQIVIIEVDPAILSDGFDCIAGYTTASSEPTNFVNITYLLATRYPQQTPPTAITD